MMTEKWVCVSKRCTSCESFKHLPLFSGMSENEISRFAQSAIYKSYKKGQFLYVEGEPANQFYVICSGWVKLSHVTEEGDEIVIGMLTKNNTAGESSLFEHGAFVSNAQVVEDAQILSIPITLLKDHILSDSQLAINMLASMMRYQRQQEIRIEQHQLYSAPQRVGYFILGLCPIDEQKDGVVISLPYDKSLIAATLGMTGSTLSRSLNILRDETGTSVSGQQVIIDSIELLIKFLDGCYLYRHLQKQLA